MSIVYSPIGYVKSPIREPKRPEEIRSTESQLVISSEYQDAVGKLEIGAHITVIYHLHKVERKKSVLLDWIKKRTPDRPNTIGVTLSRIININKNVITVIGLDAIDGSPILDIKPFKPVFDLPPVANELVDMSIRHPVVVLTGGPGGGKSSLIEDLRKDPEWKNKFTALPETAELCRFINIPFQEKTFQKLMVMMQISLENGLNNTLDRNDRRIIISHRGSLDPLAFWLKRGWDENEFYNLVGLSRKEHYRWYCLVIHLVTSAIDVPQNYTRWPLAHRPEEPGEAILLDDYLAHIWGEHPYYFKIDNINKNWEEKSRIAKEIMKKYLPEFQE